MLTCRLQISGNGTVPPATDLPRRCVRVGTECRHARVPTELERTVRRPGRATVPPPPWTVEMAVCDHRVLAAIDGAMVFEFDVRAFVDRSRGRAIRLRLSIGAAGAVVRFEPRRSSVTSTIWDLAAHRRWQAPQPLEPGQWFVLGDNVPVSIDSRLWSSIDHRNRFGPVR